MKIFLSWSGELSKAVAERLQPWLRAVIQGLNTFISSQDINKGSLWLPKLLEELEKSSHGIICLTKENINSKWLYFEAGALFKSLNESKIYTLLINISPLEIGLPFSSFQGTIFQKKDVFRLIKDIYSSLQTPFEKMDNQQLEKQFDLYWNELEADVKKLLNTQGNERDELQDLAEELLLPVIYREAYAGDLDTVFEWLNTAKKRNVANLAGRLGFVEASLARITGKKYAPNNLEILTHNNNGLNYKSQLELLLFRFAAGYALSEAIIDTNKIDDAPEPISRTIYAILCLWYLYEKNDQKAKDFFIKTEPFKITEDASAYYRAIPMGIICFALGESELGEKYFDLVRKDVSPSQGYPFITILSNLDRLFVNTCIGVDNNNIKDALDIEDLRRKEDARIRDLKGHAWVLIKYADFLIKNEFALESFVKRTKDWKKPLTCSSIILKLKELRKRLISNSGRPLVY